MNQISLLLSTEFVQTALVATLLVCLMCGLLSPIVVLKERSYVGDTLSHLVFPGVVFGYIASEYFQFPLWACVFVGAAITGLLGNFLVEKLVKHLSLPSDAASMVSLSGFFAAGVIVISYLRGTRIDLERILFGDLLTLTWTDTLALAVMLLVVSVSIFTLRKHWDAWLSDVDFAQIAGFKIKTVARLFVILLTLSVLAGMFTVGGLMISALLALPAVITNPRSSLCWSSLAVTLVMGFVGVALAFQMDWPVGPSVILTGFFMVTCKLVGRIIRR